MKRVILVLAGVSLLFALAGCLSLDSKASPMPTPDPLTLSATASSDEGADPVEVAVGHLQTDPVEGAALDLTGERTEISCLREDAGMRLTLPEGWEHQLVSVKREATEDRDAYEDFGILFRPTDRAGSMTLWYYPQGFGVCGTGLTETKVVFPSGLTAWKGSYAGEGPLSFVVFADTPGPGRYAALNDGLSGDRLETALEILGTAILGEGSSE